MIHMPRFSHVLCLSVGLLAGSAVAQDPGGLVTGSFGDVPVELPVSADLSGATIIGTYADVSLAATQMESEQGPIMLTLSFNGELPDPGEVTLDIVFARDMGRNWAGDESSLTLELDTFELSGELVAVAGTVTGEITGGPEQATRPVTLSFNAQLEQLD